MAPRTALVALVLALLSLTSNAAFIAIDFGSEWTKASLMSPGRPIDVLLNTDSKRKMQSVVGWNRDNRVFGTDAFNLAARFPTDSFPSLKYLQGSLCGGSQSRYYQQITKASIFENDRKTCSLKRPDGTEWGVEELIAMQFAYIKDLAEKEAKSKITEAVVTVPPFYSQFERQAVLDALDIAGLKPIGLVNDGLAVAINYATSRTFTEPETHLIYDAGASSITATAVTFSSQPLPETKSSKNPKQATHIEVKAWGFDPVASGTELDRRLRDHLVQMFEKKHNRSLKDEARALTRLWKEAQRVKTVLSANKDASIKVESLVNDIDFKGSVTRAEFEKMCIDLIPRFSLPVMDALKTANLTLDDITSVIMSGGVSRVPMLRETMQTLIGDVNKVAYNVNADEAAVLGAAFYGATTKPSWRTKPMRFHDIGGYDINLKYRKENSNRELVSPILSFKSKTGPGNLKKLTFPRRTKDFEVTVAYKQFGGIDFPQEIFSAKISGVEAALANATSEGVTVPQVRASFGYSESGMVFIDEAVVTGEVKRQSIADKVKDYLGNKESAASSSSESTESSTGSPAATPSAEPDVATAPEILTIPLTIEITPMSVKPLTADEKTKSQARLAAILDAERAKVRREEALNNLEGYLYRLRDLLEDKSNTFHEFVQPEEETKLVTGLDETLSWLHNDADSADAATLWKKRNDLESVESPVIARYKEAASGPKALSNLQKAHALANAFLKEARANRTIAIETDELVRFTEADLEPIETQLRESEEWLREKTEQQKKLSKRQNPVLKTSEMETKGVALQKLVKGLERRKPYRKPKPKTTSTASTPAAETPAETPAGTSDEKRSSQHVEL